MTNEELIEEVKRYYSDNFDYISSDQPTLSILTNIAGHFAEWGYLRAAEKYNEIEYNRQRAEESVSTDLEEAAKEYEKRVIEETKCHHNALTYAEGYENALLLIPDAFISGAKWQAGQMMEDAVEVCTVVEEGRYCQEIGPLFLDERAGFKPGQKVRIIIVKD